MRDSASALILGSHEKGKQMELIMIGAVIVITGIWIITVRCRLVAMGEHIDQSMKQIGVQLDSCFEVLDTVLELAKRYAGPESQAQLEAAFVHHSDTMCNSFPKELQQQENVIGQALDCINVVAEQCPELKTDEKYLRCMNAVDRYEKMVRTGGLIYNDSVTKLNRELRLFPVSLIGGLLGFKPREYLEFREAKV